MVKPFDPERDDAPIYEDLSEAKRLIGAPGVDKRIQRALRVRRAQRPNEPVLSNEMADIIVRESGASLGAVNILIHLYVAANRAKQTGTKH